MVENKNCNVYYYRIKDVYEVTLVNAIVNAVRRRSFNVNQIEMIYRDKAKLEFSIEQIDKDACINIFLDPGNWIELVQELKLGICRLKNAIVFSTAERFVYAVFKPRFIIRRELTENANIVLLQQVISRTGTTAPLYPSINSYFQNIGSYIFEQTAETKIPFDHIVWKKVTEQLKEGQIFSKWSIYTGNMGEAFQVMEVKENCIQVVDWEGQRPLEITLDEIAEVTFDYIHQKKKYYGEHSISKKIRNYFYIIGILYWMDISGFLTLPYYYLPDYDGRFGIKFF